MPYCQHCGSLHADDASFCPQCGSWVGSVGSLPAQAVTTPYGGFWARVGAYLIDSLIVAIPVDVLLALVGAYSAPTITSTTDQNGTVHIHWHGDVALFTVTILAGHRGDATARGPGRDRTPARATVSLRRRRTTEPAGRRRGAGVDGDRRPRSRHKQS